MRISDWSSDVCSSDLIAETRDRIRKWSPRAFGGAPLCPQAQAAERDVGGGKAERKPHRLRQHAGEVAEVQRRHQRKQTAAKRGHAAERGLFVLERAARAVVDIDRKNVL